MDTSGANEGSSGYENIDQLPSGEGDLLQIKQEGRVKYKRTPGLKRPGAYGKKKVRRLMEQGFPGSRTTGGIR